MATALHATMTGQRYLALQLDGFLAEPRHDEQSDVSIGPTVFRRSWLTRMDILDQPAFDLLKCETLLDHNQQAGMLLRCDAMASHFIIIKRRVAEPKPVDAPGNLAAVVEHYEVAATTTLAYTPSAADNEGPFRPSFSREF